MIDTHVPMKRNFAIGITSLRLQGSTKSVRYCAPTYASRQQRLSTILDTMVDRSNGISRRVSFRRGVSFRRRSTASNSSTSSTLTVESNSSPKKHGKLQRRHSDGGALIQRRTSTTLEEWDVSVIVLCCRFSYKSTSSSF